MRKNDYYEIQNLQRWMLWAFFIPVMTGLMTFNVNAYQQQILHGYPIGAKPLPDAWLVIVLVCISLSCIILFILVLNLQMEVKVDKWGVYYRYIPFITSWVFIPGNDIKEWKVDKIASKTLGVRPGFNFRTLYVKGNTALHIMLYHGKIIRLGTQREKELRKAMDLMTNRNME